MQKKRVREEKKKKKKERIKKGLSTVVVTLIVILVSLVAIGILWVAVKNLILKDTEEVSSGVSQFLIDLELQNVYVQSNGDIDITVKRNAGAGDLEEINFIVSDGNNSEVITKDTDLKELETDTFTIVSSEYNDSVTMIKEVSIESVTESGVMDMEDTEEVSNKNTLSGLGAVSWWKLDWNAADEMGNNPGTIIGNFSFITGKFNGVANLTDINGGKIDAGNNQSLNGKNGFSYSLWIRRDILSRGGWPYIFYHGGSHYYYALMSAQNGSNIYFEYALPPYNGSLWATPGGMSLPAGEWHHFVITYDGYMLKSYKDGVYMNNKTNVSLNPVFDRVSVGSTTFTGQIDEAIFFNRALTDSQVQSLYKLDLSSA